jgi:Indoleamine 2,3-dioxygenase
MYTRASKKRAYTRGMIDAFPGVPEELFDSWLHDLAGENGFLPRLTPVDALPEPWLEYLNTALELPSRYHVPGADVRPWLHSVFALPMPNADALLEVLSESEADLLETVVGVLSHAFRWASAPPLPERYLETAVSLPAGLADVWAAFGRARGHPRVANMFSMVLANWRLTGVPGGKKYRAEQLSSGAFEIAIPWLQHEKLSALTTFLATSIETEARGARAVKSAVQLIGAVRLEDTSLVTELLGQLGRELERMSEPFMFNVRKANFSSDDFLTLIQPTTVWGLDEGEGVLEGASGPQIGALQIADSVLGIDRSSPMGQAVLHSRKYLPARHRRFIEMFELHCPAVSAFVLAQNNPALTEPFNACLDVMMGWRRMHQKRGAMNLKSQTPNTDLAYTSSGGVIALEDERIARFEASMEDRMDETRVARAPVFSESDLIVPNPQPVDRSGLPERRGRPVPSGAQPSTGPDGQEH